MVFVNQSNLFCLCLFWSNQATLKFSQKKSVPKETRINVVRVHNLRLK